MNWLVLITGVIFIYMIIKSGDGWATEAVWEICGSQFLSKGWLYLILFLEIRLDNWYSANGEESLKGSFLHCNFGIFFSIRFNFNYSILLWLLFLSTYPSPASAPILTEPSAQVRNPVCFHTSESKWTTTRYIYFK